MKVKGRYLIIFLFLLASLLGKTLNINATDAETYFKRGDAYVAKGDYDRVISDCNKAIEINPRYAKAYYNRGLIYYFKGNIEKACADARQACHLGDCEALNLLQSKGYCK